MAWCSCCCCCGGGGGGCCCGAVPVHPQSCTPWSRNGNVIGGMVICLWQNSCACGSVVVVVVDAGTAAVCPGSSTIEVLSVSGIAICVTSSTDLILSVPLCVILVFSHYDLKGALLLGLRDVAFFVGDVNQDLNL